MVRLSKKGMYIDEWESANQATKTLGYKYHHISNVCKNKAKTSNGYKWMYKEDYDKMVAEQNKELVNT